MQRPSTYLKGLMGAALVLTFITAPSTAEHAFTGYVYALLFNLARLGMPLLFTVLGYVAATSDLQGREERLKHSKTVLQRIYLPALLWSVPLLLASLSWFTVQKIVLLGTYRWCFYLTILCLLLPFFLQYRRMQLPLLILCALAAFGLNSVVSFQVLHFFIYAFFFLLGLQLHGIETAPKKGLLWTAAAVLFVIQRLLQIHCGNLAPGFVYEPFNDYVYNSFQLAVIPLSMILLCGRDTAAETEAPTALQRNLAYLGGHFLGIYIIGRSINLSVLYLMDVNIFVRPLFQILVFLIALKLDLLLQQLLPEKIKNVLGL